MATGATAFNGIDFRIKQLEHKLQRMQDFLDVTEAAVFDPTDDNCFLSLLYHGTQEFALKPRQLAIELGLHASTVGRWTKDQNLPGDAGRFAVTDIVRDKITSQLIEAKDELVKLRKLRSEISKHRVSAA